MREQKSAYALSREQKSAYAWPCREINTKHADESSSRLAREGGDAGHLVWRAAHDTLVALFDLVEGISLVPAPPRLEPQPASTRERRSSRHRTR
eukprot:1061064-Rhodomonas_salina.2